MKSPIGLTILHHTISLFIVLAAIVHVLIIFQ